MPITSERETAGRAWTPGPAFVSGAIHNVEGRLLWCGSISPNVAIGEYRGDIARVQSAAHIDGISNEEAEANAAFIADAFNVTHETGLTPRQLAEQHAELSAALEQAEKWLSGWASAEPYLETIRAALSKATAGGAV